MNHYLVGFWLTFAVYAEVGLPSNMVVANLTAILLAQPLYFNTFLLNTVSLPGLNVLKGQKWTDGRTEGRTDGWMDE